MPPDDCPGAKFPLICPPPPVQGSVTCTVGGLGYINSFKYQRKHLTPALAYTTKIEGYFNH